VKVISVRLKLGGRKNRRRKVGRKEGRERERRRKMKNDDLDCVFHLYDCV
jgi:hypothetical protein